MSDNSRAKQIERMAVLHQIDRRLAETISTVVDMGYEMDGIVYTELSARELGEAIGLSSRGAHKRTQKIKALKLPWLQIDPRSWGSLWIVDLRDRSEHALMEAQKLAAWCNALTVATKQLCVEHDLPKDAERKAFAHGFKTLRSYLMTGGAPETLHEATGFNADTGLFPWESEPYEASVARDLEKARPKKEKPTLTLVRTPEQA